MGRRHRKRKGRFNQPKLPTEPPKTRKQKRAEAQAAREAREKLLDDQMIEMLLNESGTLDAATAAEVNRMQDMTSLKAPIPGDKPPEQTQSERPEFYFGRWRLETVPGVPPCTIHKDLKGRSDVFVIHTRVKGEGAIAFCSECQIDLAARLLRDILTYKDLRMLVGRMKIPGDRIDRLTQLGSMLAALDEPIQEA